LKRVGALPKGIEMAKIKRKTQEKIRAVSCNICDERIEIEPYYVRGDMLYCDECGAEYIIRSIKPLSVVAMADEDQD
jgi:predicted RNA-binding Zn-ribbon protein involved in translation (DUF1610 family)